MSFSHCQIHNLRHLAGPFRSCLSMPWYYRGCTRCHVRFWAHLCINLRTVRRFWCSCKRLCRVFCRFWTHLGTRQCCLTLEYLGFKIGSFSWTNLYIHRVGHVVAILDCLWLCDHWNNRLKSYSRVLIICLCHWMRYPETLLHKWFGN